MRTKNVTTFKTERKLFKDERGFNYLKCSILDLQLLI